MAKFTTLFYDIWRNTPHENFTTAEFSLYEPPPPPPPCNLVLQLPFGRLCPQVVPLGASSSVSPCSALLSNNHKRMQMPCLPVACRCVIEWFGKSSPPFAYLLLRNPSHTLLSLPTGSFHLRPLVPGTSPGQMLQISLTGRCTVRSGALCMGEGWGLKVFAL